MSNLITGVFGPKVASLGRYLFYRAFRRNLPIRALTDEIVTTEKICAERLDAINRLDGLCKERLERTGGLEKEAKRLREAIGVLEAARGVRKEVSQ